MTKPLKPCPFCGEVHRLYLDDSMFGYYVGCENCETRGPKTENSKSAIKKWNTRKPEAD